MSKARRSNNDFKAVEKLVQYNLPNLLPTTHLVLY